MTLSRIPNESEEDIEFNKEISSMFKFISIVVIAVVIFEIIIKYSYLWEKYYDIII